MALNPAYEAIGKGFVQQYYALFDDPATRPSLVNMYNVCIFQICWRFYEMTIYTKLFNRFQVETSFMTFEGLQIQGSIKIMEKLNVSCNCHFCKWPLILLITKHFFIILCFWFQGLSFQKINRIITAIDSQPMFDGGVLINVLGRLQVYCTF